MEYHTKHADVLNYILQSLDSGVSSNREMDMKNLNTDFGLKIPHLAHIIYMVVKAKHLDLNKALAFITFGMDEDGKPITIDTPLADSIKVINKITSGFEKILSLEGKYAELSLAALGTFPDKSKMAYLPINEAIAQVVILRAYINALIAYCNNVDNDTTHSLSGAARKPQPDINQYNQPPIKPKTIVKDRHGFVTFWLVLMIVLSALSAITNFNMVITNKMHENLTPQIVILLGVLGLVDVVFSVLLYQSKKIGFWGIVATSIIIFIIKSATISIESAGVGLIEIAVLYGVLQIKKDGISAWDNLE